MVVGLPHPLRHLKGVATAALRAAGVRVDVLGSSPCLASIASQEEALHACLAVNEVMFPTSSAQADGDAGRLATEQHLGPRTAPEQQDSSWRSAPGHAVTARMLSRAWHMLLSAPSVPHSLASLYCWQSDAASMER